MGDDKEWQKQLMNAALMAAVRTAIQYITNPDSREETVSDVKSKLAEVDYTAAARAVSDVIDRLADSSKSALNEAIDSIRENAEDAVEAAAEKAQEQLGTPKKRGRGRLFFGILLGIGLGFVLLNEDRRNQLLDKVTGASGPIDSSQWSTVTSDAETSDGQGSQFKETVARAQETASQAKTAVQETAAQAKSSAHAVADEAAKQATETVETAKDEAKKVKASAEAKAEESKTETPKS